MNLRQLPRRLVRPLLSQVQVSQRQTSLQWYVSVCVGGAPRVSTFREAWARQTVSTTLGLLLPGRFRANDAIRIESLSSRTFGSLPLVTSVGFQESKRQNNQRSTVLTSGSSSSSQSATGHLSSKCSDRVLVGFAVTAQPNTFEPHGLPACLPPLMVSCIARCHQPTKSGSDTSCEESSRKPSCWILDVCGSVCAACCAS